MISLCTIRSFSKFFWIATLSIPLTACGSMERIASIGQEPKQSQISNPLQRENYQPVSLPMPAPQEILQQDNSLWSSNRKTFFEDQRARKIGDILTVVIDIQDEAALENESERTRDSSEDATLGALLGYEQALSSVLPEAVVNTDLVDADADSRHVGSGKIERDEEVKVKVAALITQILPNGNLVIHGRQEVRVNFENRILSVDGVIRPEDVSTENTVNHDQIAEARISYGGKGHITDVQQPRYGQQLYDVIFPF